VIEAADVVLEVLDARDPLGSRSRQVLFLVGELVCNRTQLEN
jgi:ribosome biogenesis GTPase A